MNICWRGQAAVQVVPLIRKCVPKLFVHCGAAPLAMPLSLDLYDSDLGLGRGTTGGYFPIGPGRATDLMHADEEGGTGRRCRRGKWRGCPRFWDVTVNPVAEGLGGYEGDFAGMVGNGGKLLD